MQTFDEIFDKLDRENKRYHSLLNFLITELLKLRTINVVLENKRLEGVCKEVEERIRKELEE